MPKIRLKPRDLPVQIKELLVQVQVFIRLQL